MLVSIIIPCYNNELTIIETISSVLSQTYSFIEIIIVNDGSTDNSLNIVEKFIKSNPKITFLSKENQGPSHTRNYGANYAAGDFLIFLDADDKIDSTYVEKCIMEYKKDPTLDIVYSDALFFGSKNGKWDLPEYNEESFLIENCIPIYAMIRKKTFIEVGKFDENLKFIEDWELWIRILKRKGNVYKIPEILFYYRKSPQKTSLTDLNKKINNDISDSSRMYIYNKHYEYYKKYNLSISTLLTSVNSNLNYRRKYYNVWYRKYFYKFFKKQKFKLLYNN